MKHAFSMLELVFAIVVIGILSAIILPRTETNPTYEAAVQVLSHIKYTQHLAIIDDKFSINDPSWYKKRWQIVFGSNSNSDNKPAYTIFSDILNSSTGDPNEEEIAKNPQNNSQLMSGGYTGANALDINNDEFKGMPKMNLGLSYSIVDYELTDGCSDSRIAFDHLGRPIKGRLGAASGGGNVEAYESDNLIQEPCYVKLKGLDTDVSIKIEPETGYACILKPNNSECINR